MRFCLGLDASMAAAQPTPPPSVHHFPTPHQIMKVEFLGENSLHSQSKQDDASAAPLPVTPYRGQPIENKTSPSTQSSLTDEDSSSDLLGDPDGPPSTDQIEFSGDKEWVSFVHPQFLQS